MIKVFVVSSTLGYIKRGLESFSQEVFDVLLQDNSLDITLFKGSGKPSNKEIVLGAIPYNANITKKISKFFPKENWRDPYFLHQLSFFVNLLPHIHLKKPDIIFFSEATVGTLLLHWRRLTKQKYKLLFHNGSPCTPTLFHRWDRIHQVAPTHFNDALNVGVPAEKQNLVVYGINAPSEIEILVGSEKEALRQKLALPAKRPLIISVAAINKSHKRMDYLIHEIASLPEPRPYLLLVGHQDEESQEILQLGNELLGQDNFQIRTVPQTEVTNYYKIADVFVLASIREGLPRVILEAMTHGLPCLMHDYEIARFALGNNGYFANFELPGSLATLVSQVLAGSEDLSKRQLRHRSAYERFSWDKLRPEYIKLIQQCANS
ncbi:MAG: glycosyltransferase family 4 protein [Heteroscytonema crispum UTEX LB 1556]